MIQSQQSSYMNEQQIKRVSLIFPDTMSSIPAISLEEVQHDFNSLQIDLSSSDHTISIPVALDQLTCGEDKRQNSKSDEVSVCISLDPPYRFRSTSPAFLEKFRFKSQDINSSSLRLLFGPDTDVQAIRSIITNHLTPCVKVILYRKDGEEIRCSVRSVPSCAIQEDTCTLAFDIEGGCCTSPEPLIPSFNSMRPGDIARPRPERVDSFEAPSTCTLLSRDLSMDDSVAIHVRAVRNAAAAAFGRRHRHAGSDAK